MQKLTFVFKEKHNMLPEYLSDLFPNFVSDTSPYNLRNNQDYVTVPRRLEIYSKSVIPSSVKLWNELSDDIRNCQSLISFKYNLKQMFKPQTVPKYFLSGNRTYSVYHARIRNKCSNLNDDLSYNFLRNDSFCQCCNPKEDSFHFFLECVNYNNQRRILYQSTTQFHPLTINKILFGDENLTEQENTLLFIATQNYIKKYRTFQALI